MITATLAMPLIVTSTLATIIFIGLGFLPTPSRATALWSAGFANAMVGSYFWLAYEIFDIAQLRAIGSGLVIAPIALMWSGLRTHRGAVRQYIPLSVAFLIATPLVLTLASYTETYGVVFRVVFTATAVFAALTIAELIRLGIRQRDESLPLLLASAVLIVFAAVTIVDGVLVARHITANPDSLQFLRTLNMVGANAYVICNLVTMLLLTTRVNNGSKTVHDAFEQTANNRLNRAEAANDPWWSLLDIRLDEPDDILAASSTAAFNEVSKRFMRDVELVLPADADIKRMNSTRIIALVPRAQGGVREVLTELLERISTVDERQAVPVRMSASVGWAQVPAAGYCLEDLIEAAAAAVQVAQSNGGDRWERVGDPVQ